MDNPLKNLNLKWWHSVLLAISSAIFIISITVQLPQGGIDNQTLQYVSSGVFFLSLGSFANQTFQTRIVSRYTITKDVSKVTFFGVLFYIIGAYLLYNGLF